MKAVYTLLFLMFLSSEASTLSQTVQHSRITAGATLVQVPRFNVTTTKNKDGIQYKSNITTTTTTAARASATENDKKGSGLTVMGIVFIVLGIMAVIGIGIFICVWRTRRSTSTRARTSVTATWTPPAAGATRPSQSLVSTTSEVLPLLPESSPMPRHGFQLSREREERQELFAPLVPPMLPVPSPPTVPFPSPVPRQPFEEDQFNVSPWRNAQGFPGNSVLPPQPPPQYYDDPRPFYGY